MEQELIHRWWGRTIGEKIAKPITAGIGAFRRGFGGAMEHGDLGDVRAAILDAPRTLQWAYDVLGADAITFSENVEAELKGRLTEVTPQLAQALMVGPRMGFNIVENVRGRLDETVKQIKELLGGRGLIEESY